MRSLHKALVFALSVAAVATAAGPVAAARPAFPAPASIERHLAKPLGPHSIAPAWALKSGGEALCEQADVGHAACFAAANLAATMAGPAPAAVYGLRPADLSNIYAYPQPGSQGVLGAGQTVAIVVAHDYDNAESDLAVYRRYFNLPPCTMAGGCLSKVGPAAPPAVASNGASPQSISANPTTPNEIGWAAEEDIDMDVTSAVCPNCRIVLAEAKSDSLTDLANAVTAALRAGATIVNASYGARESRFVYQPNSPYENGRVKVVAASGDWGYVVYYPAADPDVIAVGGTTLNVTGNQVSESVWAGTGSGCSELYAKPLWQSTFGFAWGACRNRNLNDVAALADPRTGVAMYDSALFGRKGGGWSVAGGTSVSAPIITAMYALSGDTARGSGAQELYAAKPGAWLPVTSGANAWWCRPSYLCTAGPVYNGPAGLGVPHGLTGF